MVKENTAEPLTDQHFTELFRHINVTETVPTQTEDLATSLQSRFLKVLFFLPFLAAGFCALLSSASHPPLRSLTRARRCR
jgi:hypothetical protein